MNIESQYKQWSAKQYLRKIPQVKVLTVEEKRKKWEKLEKMTEEKLLKKVSFIVFMLKFLDSKA